MDPVTTLSTHPSALPGAVIVVDPPGFLVPPAPSWLVSALPMPWTFRTSAEPHPFTPVAQSGSAFPPTLPWFSVTPARLSPPAPWLHFGCSSLQFRQCPPGPSKQAPPLLLPPSTLPWCLALRPPPVCLSACFPS